MSYSEAIYQSERIACDKIRKNIAEILSLDKEFFPFYENIETKETIYVREVYQKIHYSVALADLLELTYEQYEKLKESK